MSVKVTIKRLLILDDDPDYRKLLLVALKKHFSDTVLDEYDIQRQGIPTDDFNWSVYDVLLLDYDLRQQGVTGLDLLEKLGTRDDFPAVIMLTGAGNEEVSVRAMKAGVHDYLRKQTLKLNMLHNLAEAIVDACSRRRAERDRNNALEAARKVAKLEASKIYSIYMAKYKAVQSKEEARIQAELAKLKAELQNHLKLLKTIEKSRVQAEQARQQAQEELEKLEVQLRGVKATLDSNAVKLLQQQREAAELRLRRTQDKVMETAQEHRVAEDVLAKSRWKLEQQADIQRQLEADLETFTGGVDDLAKAAAPGKKKVRTQADDLVDEISSQLKGIKGPE